MKAPTDSDGKRSLKSLGEQDGFILIAALTLMATLVLVGATTYIVSSSNTKVGANFKTSQTALQVAMAGAERGREILRALNASSTNKTQFSEELAQYVGANGQLNGNATSSDDPLLATGTLGSYAYNAYLTNNSSATDSQMSTTDNDGIAMITTIATGPNNSKAVVITQVKTYSIPNAPGAIYSKDNVTLNGSSLSINGNDASGCGGTNQPPVFTMNPAYTCYPGTAEPRCNNQSNANGPNLSGNPSTPQYGPDPNIDINTLVSELKNAATNVLTANQTNATFGADSDYRIVYADATTLTGGELRLNNVTGYGILVVKGNLQLAGNLSWNGPIIVTGVVTSSGGGSDPKSIQGQIISGSSALGDTTVSGSISIGYNSCNVLNAFSVAPLRVVNWRNN
jgi:hypothetical protein